MSEQPICVGCESTFEGGYSGTTVGYADWRHGPAALSGHGST